MAKVEKARNALHRARAEADLRRRGHADIARAVAVSYRAAPRPDVASWSERIEGERRRLHGETAPLFDATVGVIARRDSSSKRRCQFMATLVAETKARSVVEMGTAVGISGAYLAAGLAVNGEGRLITLDLDPERHAVATTVFDALGLADRVEMRTGNFDDTYAQALADAAPIDILFIDGNHQHEPTIAYYEAARPHLRPGAVVIFDDIRWSDGMRAAWSAVKASDQTAVAADLGPTGLVRVR